MILSKNFNHHLPSYDNIILLGDFNSETSELHMVEFCNIFKLVSLITEKTCFKSIEKNPLALDLILINRPQGFQRVIETDLFDFHKLIITVLKTSFRKKPPKIISYRKYKKFSPINFRNELKLYLSGIGIYIISNDDFVSVFMDILDLHAPTKTEKGK